jgi:hypothetical protein
MFNYVKRLFSSLGDLAGLPQRPRPPQQDQVHLPELQLPVQGQQGPGEVREGQEPQI